MAMGENTTVLSSKMQVEIPRVALPPRKRRAIPFYRKALSFSAVYSPFLSAWNAVVTIGRTAAIL